MSKEIYISTTPHETRLAIVEDEQLAEVYYERENEYSLAGSIYNGKVTRVLPGMQSSFVDIGLERDAFLYVTDFMEEAGDSADFETDGGGRKPQAVQAPVDAAETPREGGRSDNARDGGRNEGGRDGGRGEGGRAEGGRSRDEGRRGRGGRDRGNREQARPVVAETPLFEEPIAPKPVEASAVAEVGAEDAGEEQGSRRWRGRRGRRRGRGGREGGSPLAVGAEGEAGVEPTDEPERLSLDGSAETSEEDAVAFAPIEIDVEAEPRAPENGEPRRFSSDRARGGRGGRNRGGREDRGGRGREDRPRRTEEPAFVAPEVSFAQEEARNVTHGGSYDAGSYGDVAAEPVAEAIVLPGESIRKYRDPVEVAAEDAAKRPAGGGAEVVVLSAPAIEITGWDGGSVLPGETLSQHRGRDASAPVRREESREDNRRGGRPGRNEPRNEGRNEPRNDARNEGRGRGRGSFVAAVPAGTMPAQTAETSEEEVGGFASLQPIDLQAYALTPVKAEEQVAPSPIADVEEIAAAAAPEETGGLTQHPAHADESAAVGPVVDATEPEPVATESVEAGHTEVEPVEVGSIHVESIHAEPIHTASIDAEPAEYEPGEGEAASLGDGGRRDYRRLEQRPEAVESADGPGAAEAEVLASVPDATTYDLGRAEDREAADGGPLDLSLEPMHGELAHEEPAQGESHHELTSLQPSGEMVSEPELPVDDAVHLPVMQDADEPIEMATTMQASVLSGQQGFVEESASGFENSSMGSSEKVEGSLSLQPEELLGEEVEDFEEPMHDGTLVSEPGDAVSQVHAYGDGELEEEEVDGEEYEYDLAPASADEDEFEDYEEETLSGSDAIDSVLEEMSLDEDGADEDGGDDAEQMEYQAESAAGGFTVDDFGGEPAEVAESAPSTQNGQERRGRREGGREGSRDGRRGGSRDRDRRPGGGFRGGATAAASGGGDRGRGRGRQSVQTMDLPAINELLKPGQEVLLQIAKEPIAKKGARVTSHIALPGRFLVFMPTVNHTGVSRKISSDEERRRLKTILLSEKGDAQGGFIVRTAADGASEEELRNDLRFLIQLWQDIKARSESSKSPALIYHDLSLIERILRDQVTDNFSAIWVDTEAEYERVLRFLQRFQPSLVRRVKLYTKETPLFEHFGVTAEIDRALKSKVWLKSGGSIVIDQTEALVAIDINTGKYVGKTARLEDTILKTNLDAIPEIVRQIRLRDLGGIIVIDFIDMDERKNRARVMQVLEEELKSDRAPSKVLPFNDFGLVIMTRKRVKQSLERTLCIPDPITDGTGMIKSPITVANEIFIEMRKMQRHFEKTDVMLRVHPEVVKTLKANGGKRLQELEEMTRKTILVKSDPAINPEQFDIH